MCNLQEKNCRKMILILWCFGGFRCFRRVGFCGAKQKPYLQSIAGPGSKPLCAEVEEKEAELQAWRLLGRCRVDSVDGYPTNASLGSGHHLEVESDVFHLKKCGSLGSISLLHFFQLGWCLLRYWRLPTSSDSEPDSCR